MLIKQFMPGDCTLYVVGLSLVKRQLYEHDDIKIAYVFGTENKKRIGIFTIGEHGLRSINTVSDYVDTMSIDTDHYNKHSILTGLALLTYIADGGSTIYKGKASYDTMVLYDTWDKRTKSLDNIRIWTKQVEDFVECIVSWKTAIC